MFDDAIALLEHLETAHEPGVHLYRGQTRRFFHDWADADGPVRLESVYPSDFRFITGYDHPSRVPVHDVRAARAHGREIRDTFAHAVMLRALGGDPSVAWLGPHVAEYKDHLTGLSREVNSGRRLADVARESDSDLSQLAMPLFRLLWSLAQHYLIATALTDVTFSLRIAVWFATHPSDAADPVPTDGTGVIYRFRRDALEAVLAHESREMTEWARERGELRPPGLFFMDIRTIPAAFARRPAGQQGGSIYGFDQPSVLRAVFERGCADIFEFRHGPPRRLARERTAGCHAR
jgi:hypothetical protein